MSLEVAQYRTVARNMFDEVHITPWGPPISVDTITDTESVVIIPGSAMARLVRILANGVDQKLEWSTGVVETFKLGVHELRLMEAGDVITCQAA